MKLPKTYLIERFRPTAEHILDLLTKTKDDQENKEVQSYYRKLAEWGSKHLQKAGKIELDKINLSYKDEVIKLGLIKHTKDLWGMIDALINLMKKPGLKDEDIRVIQQTTLEILAGLSGLKNTTKPTEDPEDPEDKDTKDDNDEDPEDNDTNNDNNEDPDENEAVSNKGKLDWTAERARRLRDAKKTNKTASEVLNKFYDDYYSQEYAGVESPKKDTKGIVAKLKSLDKILNIEFNKLGYNSEVNPFAQFLKILIQKKPAIFSKLTTNNYGAIHNSFIEKYVTGNMLGNYNKGNILFCEDLYNKNGLDIVEYLSLQNQALNHPEITAKYADTPKNNIIAILFIAQKPLSDDYEENINLLRKSKDIILPAANGAKIKSLLEVKELYRHLFKTDAKKIVNSKTGDDILNAALKENIILDMISYILEQSAYTDKYTEDAKKNTAWLKARGYQRNNDHINSSKSILSRYIINAEALNLIIKKLKHYITEQKPTEKKN